MSREFGVTQATGTRAKVTIYPSKRDRQFVFGTVSGGSRANTANDILWISAEANYPVEYWSDTYVDIEMSRWGYTSSAVTWFEGCGRKKPSGPAVGELLEAERLTLNT